MAKDDILAELAEEENTSDRTTFTLKLTGEVREKLDWLRKQYRFESMAHTLRIIIIDTYERMQKAQNGTDINEA